MEDSSRKAGLAINKAMKKRTPKKIRIKGMGYAFRFGLIREAMTAHSRPKGR